MRTARPEDLLAVRELWRQVSAEVGVGGPSPDGDGRLFVATRGQEVVGCALAGLEADLTAWITDVAVQDTSRRQGVGRRLVGAALRWARRRGAQSVHVEAARRAEDFWRTLGFRGDGPDLERIP